MPQLRLIRTVFLISAVVPLTENLLADQARDNRWKQDVATLSTQLPALAANLFFLLPRAQFDQAIADLTASIPSISDAEIIVGMARIVAMAGDAHTQIFLIQDAAGFRPLPLTLAWFQDGLYVTAAAPEYQQALTAKVVQIGDKTVDEAYQAVSAVISHENDYWVRVISPRYLKNADILYAQKITSRALPVRYVFENSRGNQFSMDIDYRPGSGGVSAVDPGGFTPLHLRNASLPYWATYLSDSRTLYFKYNQCIDDPSLPFAAYAARIFAAFDANPVDRLVVDLRDNGGGEASVINPFMDGLQQRQAQFGNPTRLYVLINGRTFSSAMLNAESFRDDHFAAMKLLGEPTGGNPTVPWRTSASFTLPNSGLTVDYTTALEKTTSYQPGGAVMPDILLPLRSYEYFSQHDPVLAAVLADSDADPAPVASDIVVINAAGPRQGTAVSPGSLVSAFGDFSGTATADAAGLPLPVDLGGVQVLVDNVAAQLLATRPSQINFLVPPASPTGRATVRVVHSGATLASGTFDIAAAAPGIFSVDPADPARPGAILNQDNTLNTRDTPAASGQIIQVYATGINLPPAVFVGYMQAEVIFSGSSGQFPGLWQVNAKIPTGVVAHGQVPIFLVSGANASNAVTLWIQ